MLNLAKDWIHSDLSLEEVVSKHEETSNAKYFMVNLKHFLYSRHFINKDFSMIKVQNWRWLYTKFIKPEAASEAHHNQALSTNLFFSSQ